MAIFFLLLFSVCAYYSTPSARLSKHAAGKKSLAAFSFYFFLLQYRRLFCSESHAKCIKSSK